jgi:PAS domain S-box-containing protein
MTDQAERPRRTWAALRDLALISLAVVGLLWAGLETGLLDRVHDRLNRSLPGPTGDLLLGLSLASLATAILATFRWRTFRSRILARERTDGRFALLVENLPAVTYTWDPRHPVGTSPPLYVSPQVSPILGLSAREWRDEPEIRPQHLHPDDRDHVVRTLGRAARRGEPVEIEYRHVRADGTVIWVREEARVVERDTSGTPTLVQSLVHDITERKRSEEHLAQAEARYRTLVERLPAVTYTWSSPGRNGTATSGYVSPQVELLLGFASADFADPALWNRLIHPDDHARVMAEWENSRRNERAFACEYRMRTRDEATIWVRDEAVPIGRGDAGEVIFQGVVVDVTERRKAEEQLREAEARYRAIVEHVPAAIYVDRPDTSMRTVYVSPQIEDIMGVSAQRFVDEPDLWLDLMAPEFREEMRRTYVEALEEHRPWRGEYRIIRPDGREVWVHDETTVVTDDEGTPLFVQGVFFDITERKLAEQALRDSERREREAAERLRALDEMKNTFLAAVSHELRSPLTSILGMAVTLEHQRLPAADRRDLTGRLVQNARKLDRLLKDLLDIDRLSRGNVTPQLRPTDVGALAAGTIESLEIGDRRIEVEAEPVTILVDGPKVERIVENLVMNAIRHTDPEACIWVRVWSGGGGIFLAVEDDGAGVPPELQSAIFEPFRQGPTASPHSPGTGVGLSLVAMFAELHGGRAWVEDREGGGASFRVFLPGEEVSEEDDPIPPATPSSNGQRIREGARRAVGSPSRG